MPAGRLKWRDLLIAYFIIATFRQRFCRLSVPPKSVVKLVESIKTISPARCSFGGKSRNRHLKRAPGFEHFGGSESV